MYICRYASYTWRLLFHCHIPQLGMCLYYQWDQSIVIDRMFTHPSVCIYSLGPLFSMYVLTFKQVHLQLRTTTYVCVDVQASAFSVYYHCFLCMYILYLRRASLLWLAIDSVSAKALWRQCFNESTSNVSYVDDTELGNWSKVMPMPTMWQCSG